MTISAENPMNKVYDKLAQQLIDQHLGPNNDETTQHWIAIAGGPGSGKTTTAEAISERLNEIEPDCSLVIPMDGFHYSKEQLKELDPPDGENYYLRRGAPWTFNAEYCNVLLSKAKVAESGIFPIYDRKISDPVFPGVELLPHHRIVLIEGNYLLMKDDPRWEPLDDLWDERWFVKAPSLDIQRERLIERSLKTWTDAKSKIWGPGEQGAAKRVDFNDVRNMKLVASSEKYAEVIVETL